MAFEEVSRVEITDLIRRWQAGEKIREMARATGLSRNTTKKYIRAAEALGVSQQGPPATEPQIAALVQLNVAGRHPAERPSESELIPWADQIYRWLKEDRLEMTRIHELLA